MLICILILTILGILLLRKRKLWDVKIGPLKISTMTSIIVWVVLFFLVGPIFALVLLFLFEGIPWFCRLYYKKEVK